MTINLDHYRSVIPTIISMTQEVKTAKERYKLLSRIALATSCHILAVVYYLAELYGMDEDLQGFIDRRQKDFYNVDGIIGYKEIKTVN
jgi:hypothetical protein